MEKTGHAAIKEIESTKGEGEAGCINSVGWACRVIEGVLMHGVL
jgi:hypothetical protein